ncbi:ATP-binding component of an ABC superfamily transporter [Tetragenococcus muriaticus 3MR10-3]|uniref:ATP-binding component of an ABC superfamily transporter n=1 Tax=Tetragenococcus muriaticus 3MR10-3 TaxID=1302648 RepID=A0A091C0U2_9ENTE|nr:ATP-binding component of an ABC superfamily transporter [Tetragenococcus muriaticus 3MR10-3]
MLVLENLSKSFGNYQAVDQLSFTIDKGKIMGLIGQNGAGKTTTFRLILNFLQADEGKVLWNGGKLGTKEYNTIGYLPEERGLYPRATIYEQLIYFARLRGRTKKKLPPKLMNGWIGSK